MEKHTIIPAVALILERGEDIFVGRRMNTGYCDGMLNLPAGHIEADETPREAIVRECKEEIGIDISIEDLEFVHVQYNRNDMRPDRTHYYYRLECNIHTPSNREPEKCSEVFWLKKGERLNEFAPFMESALESIARGEQYSEFFESFQSPNTGNS